MSVFNVTTTGTAATVTLGLQDNYSTGGGDPFAGNPIVLTHPETRDLAELYSAEPRQVALDTLLAAALDAGEVTMTVDGVNIPDSATLITLGASTSASDNQTLAEVLTQGNTTGANNIDVSPGQSINFGPVGNETDLRLEQLGDDETMKMYTKYGFIVEASDASGLVDIGGNYIAASDSSGSGNSIQMDATGATQLTMSQNFGAGIMRLRPVTLTAGRDILIPDNSGTMALTSDIPAAQDLASVLATGNLSGANDLAMQAGQKIYGAGDPSTMWLQADSVEEGWEIHSDAITKFFFSGATGLDTDTHVYLEDGGIETYRSTNDNKIRLNVATTSPNTVMTEGATGFTLTTTTSGLTANRAQTTQDADGVIALTANIDNATLATKAGIESAGFSGSPLTKAVVFSTAFADADYSVSIIGSDARSWTVDSQTAAGFTINTNSSTALTGDVSWTAIKHGETS